MDSEETLKYLQQKYPEDLINTYKSKRQFVKDFNSVPITSNGNNKTLV